MHIVHVIPSISPLSGGPAYALSQYANMANDWAKVSILTTWEGWTKEDDIKTIREYWKLDSEINIQCFAYLGRHSWKYSRSLFSHLSDMVSDISLLHIHACFSLISTRSSYWAQKNQISYIRRPLGTLAAYSRKAGMSTLKNVYWNLLEKQTLAKACRIHCTSKQEAEDIKALAPLTDTSIVPIPVTIPENNRNTKSEDLTLGYLGRIHPKKNLEQLIKAIYHLSDKFQINLKIAGNGNNAYIDKLKSMVQEYDLSDHVEWVGFVEDDQKDHFFRSLDWYVLPSLHENFGIAVIEAMSYGVPVIISNQIDTATDVIQAEAGRVHPPILSALIEEIEYVSNLKEHLYNKYSSNARKLVENLYSTSAISRQLKEMYQHCAGS